ncbi:hypothetical protein [Roseateles sp. P5_E11]
MRLDNYSVAPFESLDAFDPVQRDADAPRHGASRSRESSQAASNCNDGTTYDREAS